MKKEINKVPSWLPRFSGFYNTIWEPDTSSEEDYLKEQGYKGEIWDKFDTKAYEISVLKKYCNFMESELSDFVYSLEYEEIVSPRYYNFSNDSCNVQIAPNIDSIKKYIYENREAYEKYLKRYKSCDGFISSYGHTFEDWEIYTASFTDFTGHAHYLGSVLDFIAKNEDIIEDFVYDYIIGDINVSEFVSNDVYNLLYKAEDFVRNNYTKTNLLELMEEEFEEDADKLDFDVIIGRISAEIEGNTLKLAL